ncbi:MAG: hypothetical protein AB1405_12140 [Bdellovibrionota bacterium]
MLEPVEEPRFPPRLAGVLAASLERLGFIVAQPWSDFYTPEEAWFRKMGFFEANRSFLDVPRLTRKDPSSFYKQESAPRVDMQNLVFNWDGSVALLANFVGNERDPRGRQASWWPPVGCPKPPYEYSTLRLGLVAPETGQILWMGTATEYASCRKVSFENLAREALKDFPLVASK